MQAGGGDFQGKTEGCQVSGWAGELLAESLPCDQPQGADSVAGVTIGHSLALPLWTSGSPPAELGCSWAPPLSLQAAP